MANIDFDTTPVVEPSETKIFSTVETSVDFAKTFGEDVTLKRALSALQRGPGRFYRDNVIACDGDAADYMFFVVKLSVEVLPIWSVRDWYLAYWSKVITAKPVCAWAHDELTGSVPKR